MPSGGESVMAVGPATSELLSRRSEAPVVADKEGFIVDPEHAESPNGRFDPAGVSDVLIHGGWGAQPG